ncbi:SDR family NAD(P)-dependent oxidoreductase [Sporosarcina ureilytica]|uniref:2-hydroxypropyl-CoM dehydrogenase n=1 Tax=Sporosarcina ureilytica TaxID=298596 RepID=A0A1D8JFI6_9BACL|nr:SDR family NAD(P)-dependent oxidoreductase [Sporosarcina ureilytica]AOV07476.1 2-hydroxypropyl-CoM dehydrogenase [Sporosarcina ureilytica]
MRLNNKVAIITGAASGMGIGEAIRFAEEGAKVVIAELEGTQAIAEKIKGFGGEAIAVSVNVMKTEDIKNCVELTDEIFGPVDVLINNAGVFDQYAKSLDTAIDQWNFFLYINLTSIFEFSNAVLPGMIERGTGSIVNIASIAGLVAGKGGAAYTTSKHGVIGYTKHLTSEYARYGIKINAICPGTIETPLVKDFLSNIPKVLVPTHTFGTTEQVSVLALNLASDEAHFMSGAIVPIEDGFTVQ